MRRLWLVSALVIGVASCVEPPPACITVDQSCQPLYTPPTFDNVYNMTLKGSCGPNDSSCHSAAGHQGGMTFQDEQHAYDALMNGRVMPGNPGCSLMIVRTDSPGKDYQMPPGDPLTAATRCALIQWVAAGAPGPGVAVPLGAP